MVASKTSILVAAVALGAASAYAAPTALNKDIALSRREADESTLIAREFDDDELYARESYDGLGARDFDDLEARDFEDDELYARELYEDELEARELYEDELEARELYDDELEARDFEGYENLIARAVEATPSTNSTSTPSSTATSSTATLSASTGAKNDEHVLATSASSLTSTTNAGEEGHHEHHDICKPYVKAFVLAVQPGYKSHELDSLHHDSHQHDNHQHHQHHHRHSHHRNHHHHLSADKIAELCAPKIALLVELVYYEHGKTADAITAHSTESKTLKVQTPTKAKRDLQAGGNPQSDLKTPGSQNPDPAGSSSTQSPVSSGTDGPVTSALSSGSENPLPGDKKPHGRHRHHHWYHPYHHRHHRHHHHHHHHKHHQHHQHDTPGYLGNHGRHGGKHREERPLSSGALDSNKNVVTDTAVNPGAVAPANGDATTTTTSSTPALPPTSGTGGGVPQANGSPATPDSAVPAVRRRSLLGDDIYWKRTLASSLGLDLDYFTKRFYDEDGVEY